MTTVKLTEALTTHLRTLLLEDVHDQAARLAAAAHSAHEGGAADPHGLAGDDAESAWWGCGMQESAALLDLIGWSKRGEAERPRAVRDAL